LFRIKDAKLLLGAYKFTEIKDNCLFDIENSDVKMEDVTLNYLKNSKMLVIKKSNFSLDNVEI